MRFTKMHGAGNDFVMLKPGGTHVDWPQLAKILCDRRFGIGADGIILALPSKVANVKMRIFNSDGSEAETCGNGLRCLAKFVLQQNIVPAKSRQITVETIPGVRKVKLDYYRSRLIGIQVGMGIPRFKPQEIPLNLSSLKNKGRIISPILDFPLDIRDEILCLSFVSMGNPHAVQFIDQEVEGFSLSVIGSAVENAPLFPKRINFEIARVRNRHQIDARVWERGAGETLACGSGACAIAVAARLHNFVGNDVDIKLPGGILHITWNGEGEVLMSGPSEIVFTGYWPDKF